MMDITTLEGWMQQTEGENLEFKEARNRYDFEQLTQYCVALPQTDGRVASGAGLSWV